MMVYRSGFLLTLLVPGTLFWLPDDARNVIQEILVIPLKRLWKNYRLYDSLPGTESPRMNLLLHLLGTAVRQIPLGI